jgi:hypothetical protein
VLQDKILVGFDYAPPNYDLKSKIYGPNCAHVRHIEKEGGALLFIQGRGCRYPDEDDTDEPPHLIVKYVSGKISILLRHSFSHLEKCSEYL